MNAVNPGENRVIYLVERAPPPAQPEPPTALDKIKHVAGVALAMLGIAIVFGSAIALTGTLTGSVTVAVETIHTFFVTGMLSIIGGFHLAKTGSQPNSTEISAGPLALTI